MKTSFVRHFCVAAIVIAFSQAANATLLVGFHSFDNSGGSGIDNTPNEGLASFSGIISSTTSAGTTYGSADGFYGPDSTGQGGVATSSPSADNGRIANAGGTQLTVKNNSSDTYSLTSLLFDMGSTSNTGLTAINYQIKQGLAVLQSGELIGAGKVQGANPGNPLATISSGFNVVYPIGTLNAQNFSDFIANLTGLSLAAGQSIVFNWVTSGAPARIDNIAVSAIPEPASLLALGCVLGSGLMMRRRNRPSLA